VANVLARTLAERVQNAQVVAAVQIAYCDFLFTNEAYFSVQVNVRGEKWLPDGRVPCTTEECIGRPVFTRRAHDSLSLVGVLFWWMLKESAQRNPAPSVAKRASHVVHAIGIFRRTHELNEHVLAALQETIDGCFERSPYFGFRHTKSW